MIDIQKEMDTIKRGHIAVQLRGHFSCGITVNKSLKVYTWHHNFFIDFCPFLYILTE